MAEEARARYEKAMFKLVDLVIFHDLYVYTYVFYPSLSLSAGCLRDLWVTCRMTMLRRTEYKKLKKETVVLFFLAT